MKEKIILLAICLPVYISKISGQTPVDAQHPFSQILCSTTPVDYQYGIAWFQAVTLQNNHLQNGGYITVDYIKLIEEDIASGNETVLHIEEYNGSGALSLNEGGLFKRFPNWFYNDSSVAMINSNRAGGYLTLNVGQQPEKINHFWGVRQYCSLSKRHKVEIRLSISGDIALQAGMDYWANQSSTLSSDCKEAFYSNWYGNSDGQYITVKFPNYGQQNMFDRTDYGFCENGKFYLSKSLVDFVGGSSVALLSDATGWLPSLMTLNGSYYEYYTGVNSYFAQSYCFMINPGGSSFFVPHAVINNLVYQNDAVSNGQGGYNFYTLPQTTTASNMLDDEIKTIIYPNPAKTIIYINNTEQITSISFYNTYGQLALSNQLLNNKSVDISTLQPGLYMLKINTKKGEVAAKIVKE